MIWVALFRKYWVVMMMKVKDIQYCVYVCINTMLYTHSTISPGPAFPGVGYDIGWDSNLIVIKSLFAQYILHYYIGFSQQNREYSIVQLKLLREARGLGKSLTSRGIQNNIPQTTQCLCTYMLGIVRCILTLKICISGNFKYLDFGI